MKITKGQAIVIFIVLAVFAISIGNDVSLLEQVSNLKRSVPTPVPTATPAPTATPVPTATPNAQQIYLQARDSVVEINSVVGSGTGFLYGRSGRIATAFHVVKDVPLSSWEITVTVGEEKLRARVEKFDKERDLAFLETEYPLGLNPLRPNFSDLAVGQDVLVIGNSYGQYPKSLTKGIISGLNRKLAQYNDFIQFDAGVFGGNSGGPLLNIAGEVVGVVAKRDDIFGYAIPIKWLNVLEFAQAPPEKTEPVRLNISAPARPDARFFETAQYDLLLWETEFSASGGDAELRFLRFAKEGSAAVRDLAVFINGTFAGRAESFDSGSLAAVYVKWTIVAGSTVTVALRATVDVNVGDAAISLEDLGVKARDMRGRGGESISREIETTVNGVQFSQVRAGVQTIVPRYVGKG